MSELFNPKMNADLDSVIGKLGSPAEKAIFEAAKQNVDKRKTTGVLFKDLRAAVNTFDKHYKPRHKSSIFGEADATYVLRKADRDAVNKIKINENELSQLRQRAKNGDNEAQVLLKRVEDIRRIQEQYK